MTTFLCKNIANPSSRIDAPGLLRVVVKQRIRSHLIDKGLAIRLDIPLFVRRTTDDLCVLAIPFPVRLKPGLRLRQDWMVQLRLPPGLAAIRADLDFLDLAVAAPGQARNAIISGPDLHHSGGRGDDRVGVHPQLELPGLAVGQQLGVARSFPAGHPRLVAKLQATEPFYVDVALPSRNDQSERKAVSGPQRLAILPIGEDRLAHELVSERDASRNASRVAALRQHPPGSAILPDKINQESERNARPFARADQSMRVLHGQVLVGLLPVLPSVASALDEVEARDRWHGLEVVQGQDQRLLRHAMDQQPVLGG